jgi:hypothetical protein
MSIYSEMLAAGLPVIDAEEGQTPHFSRLLTLEEEDLRDSIMNKPVYRQRHAKAIAKAIPNWAGWDQVDWATWRDLNISSTQINAAGNLAEAKVVLNKMSMVLDKLVQMQIEMRNQMWSDLPD